MGGGRLHRDPNPRGLFSQLTTRDVVIAATMFTYFQQYGSLATSLIAATSLACVPVDVGILDTTVVKSYLQQVC